MNATHADRAWPITRIWSGRGGPDSLQLLNVWFEILFTPGTLGLAAGQGTDHPDCAERQQEPVHDQQNQVEVEGHESIDDGQRQRRPSEDRTQPLPTPVGSDSPKYFCRSLSYEKPSDRHLTIRLDAATKYWTASACHSVVGWSMHAVATQ
jgi:hypothetical protein